MTKRNDGDYHLTMVMVTIGWSLSPYGGSSGAGKLELGSGSVRSRVVVAGHTREVDNVVQNLKNKMDL